MRELHRDMALSPDPAGAEEPYPSSEVVAIKVDEASSRAPIANSADANSPTPPSDEDDDVVPAKKKRERRWTSFLAFLGTGAALVAIGVWPHAQDAAAAGAPAVATSVASVGAPLAVAAPTGEAATASPSSSVHDSTPGQTESVTEDPTSPPSSAQPAVRATSPKRANPGGAAGGAVASGSSPASTRFSGVIATWGTATSPVAIFPPLVEVQHGDGNR
jgi:hypothetical protein